MVKWKVYDDSENTCVPLSELSNASELVEAFDDSQPLADQVPFLRGGCVRVWTPDQDLDMQINLYFSIVSCILVFFHMFHVQHSLFPAGYDLPAVTRHTWWRYMPL